MNDNSYNIVILMIFTTVLILYINYDFRLFKKMEHFQNELNELDTNEIVLTENLDPSSSYVLDQRKDKLKHFMDKVHKLQVPINVDDNGVICNRWSNDPEERYPSLDNNYCQLTGSKAYCLNNKNDLSTCNKLYNKEIQRIATVDTDGLMSSGFNKLKVDLDRMERDIERKRIDLDDTLDRLVSKKNIISQQKFFIDQNGNRLSESKNIRNEVNDDYHKATNEYQISKYHASEGKKEINDMYDRNTTLYSVITWLSVVLVLLVIIGLLLTRVY